MEVYLLITSTFFLLYWMVPLDKLKYLFAALVIALSVMAFMVEPNATDDLGRYFNHLNNLKIGGWNYLVDGIRENVNSWRTAPINAIYFYLISLLPSVHFLPAVTIFIAYGAMFWMICLTVRRFNITKGPLFAGCLFLMATYWYYDICSGIRNGLAFTLFGFFLYLELVEKKRAWLCWIGYLLMVGLHSSALLLFLVRLLLVATWRQIPYRKLFSILLPLAFLVGIPLLESLGDVVQSDYLQHILGKADVYGSEGGFAGLLDAGTMYYSNIATYFVSTLLVVYFSGVIKKSEVRVQLEQYLIFLQYLMYLMLGALAVSMVFLRLTRWILPQLMIVLLMVGMERYQTEARARNDRQRCTVIRGRQRPTSGNAERQTHIRQAYIKRENGKLIYTLTILYGALYYIYSMIGSSLIWMHF